eukprot:TRINITY_DN6317_c0_g1_i2.p1 TRINITY_DN6317_c0_g1~~TRINITY_DN6317_c0_g1_i2.p1  ORF type:complete len:169 (+),score=26.60 TRINITY_DN6317_c0_g1_i2:158-664(+)
MSFFWVLLSLCFVVESSIDLYLANVEEMCSSSSNWTALQSSNQTTNPYVCKNLRNNVGTSFFASETSCPRIGCNSNVSLTLDRNKSNFSILFRSPPGTRTVLLPGQGGLEVAWKVTLNCTTKLVPMVTLPSFDTNFVWNFKQTTEFMNPQSYSNPFIHLVCYKVFPFL